MRNNDDAHKCVGNSGEGFGVGVSLLRFSCSQSNQPTVTSSGASSSSGQKKIHLLDICVKLAKEDNLKMNNELKIGGKVVVIRTTVRIILFM